MNINSTLKKVTVLDTETTSVNLDDAEIIEFAIAYHDENDWKIFDELFKPLEKIPPSSSAVNNITNNMVSEKNDFASFLKDAKTILNAEKYVVAHNYSFEKGILSNYGISDISWICTMRFAKRLFLEDVTVESYNLQYLRYRFEIHEPSDDFCPHRAKNDVLVTAKLFEFLTKELVRRKILDENPSIDDISEWVNEPIIYKTMPFGKYRGYKLVDIPMDYWEWALKNLDKLNESSDAYDFDFAESVAVAIEEIMDVPF